MKNIVFYSIVLISFTLSAILLFMLFDNERGPVSPQESVSVEVSTDKEPAPTIKEEIIFTEKLTSPGLALSDAKKHIKDFDIPEDIQNEFLSALENAEEVLAYNGSVTEEALDEAGLSLAQIRGSDVSDDMKNTTSGYSVDDKDFEKMVSACLPAVNEDPEASLLKSQALATIGLSAVSEHRYEQAEKAFTTLINNYPDQEPTQIARLEYSNILYEQGYVDEARQTVNEAITINSSDTGYVSIANTLKQRIERYE